MFISCTNNINQISTLCTLPCVSCGWHVEAYIRLKTQARAKVLILYSSSTRQPPQRRRMLCRDVILVLPLYRGVIGRHSYPEVNETSV